MKGGAGSGGGEEGGGWGIVPQMSAVEIGCTIGGCGMLMRASPTRLGVDLMVEELRCNMERVCLA